MEVFEAIAARRSVKPLDMKPDPVDRSLIAQLLESANWAPSHRHTEPWRFIVFSGDARLELADAVIDTMRGDDEPPIAANDARRATTATKFTTPPVVIAIICQTSTMAKVVEHEEIAATAMAVQNMHLAARALGLGGFWTSGKKAFHPRMAEYLDIESPARCLGFFFVGWPAHGWSTSERGPIEDKVSWRP